MTTLAELRTDVSRDLRDSSNRTFISANVTDLINEGIEEVSRVYPKEAIQIIPIVASTYAYATTIDAAFRLEVWRSGRFNSILAPNDDSDSGSQVGWELWADQLRVPVAIIDYLTPATDAIHVWGYSERAQLAADGDVADLDVTAEWAVRRYVRASAFQLMHADRALFKQWQAQSQNTDVSSNQLSQMMALYKSEWDRVRNQLRRLRRT